jgi:serine/threonine protein kinase
MHEMVMTIRADQRAQWEAGRRVLAEVYLEEQPALRANDELAVDVIYSEVLLREELGEVVSAEEYLRRFPQYAEKLRRQLRLHEALRTDPLPSGANQSGASPWPDLPGYEILGELGRGARGIVYRARQSSLGRVVALKMILSDEGLEIALLRREAAVLARLQHPNIVQVYELSEHAGRPYFAMEFVEGGSLESKLALGPLPPREAAVLVELLARALHAAHQEGVVHRDLKPANVLLTVCGIPKVADFGLAKRLGAGGSLIPSGAIVGTPAYMAPEQAEAVAGKIGPAVDVYALGAILHEVLAGLHSGVLPGGRLSTRSSSRARRRCRVRSRRAIWIRSASSAFGRTRRTVMRVPRLWPTTSAGSSTASRFRPGHGRGTRERGMPFAQPRVWPRPRSRRRPCSLSPRRLHLP